MNVFSALVQALIMGVFFTFAGYSVSLIVYHRINREKELMVLAIIASLVFSTGLFYSLMMLFGIIK